MKKIDIKTLTYNESFKIFCIVNKMLESGVLKIDLEKVEASIIIDNLEEYLEEQIAIQQKAINNAIKYLKKLNIDNHNSKDIKQLLKILTIIVNK